MKYVVTGMIRKEKSKFAKEVDAKSEKHAKDLVLSFFGSKHGIKRAGIEINGVKPAKG